MDKLFGSKKDQEELKEVQTEERKEEGKEEEVKITDENELVIKLLKKKLSQISFQVDDNKEMAVIPAIGTSIKAAIRGKNQQENGIIIHIDFSISNNEFGDEGIFESLAGIGKGNNLESAIGNCLDAFMVSVFKAVSESLQDNHNPNLDIETTSNGLERIWHPHVGPILAQGFEDLTGQSNDRIYNLLKDLIIKRLNNKRYYWIKVFASKQVNGKLAYQCLLNNKPFLEAERIIEEYIKGWPASNSYMAEMQYIVIRQSDKSWNESREKDIEKENFDKKCAEYAISVFEDYSPDDNVEGLINKIAEFTKDINMAWEFYWFIPAIYCRVLLGGPKYSDTVVLVLPDDRKIYKKLYDFESYVIGVDVVLQRIQTNQNQEKFQKVLFLSDEFKALQQALAGGSRPQDLQAVPMVLMAPLSYVVKD